MSMKRLYSISIVFTKKKYHRKGVATGLMFYLFNIVAVFKTY